MGSGASQEQKLHAAAKAGDAELAAKAIKGAKKTQIDHRDAVRRLLPPCLSHVSCFRRPLTLPMLRRVRALQAFPIGARISTDMPVLSAQNQWVPLHFSSYKGHAEVTKILIDGGADVNLPESKVLACAPPEAGGIQSR